MSDTNAWTDRDDAPVDGDAPPVAEQMRLATQSLRAHLSLVRDPDEGPLTAGS